VTNGQELRDRLETAEVDRIRRYYAERDRSSGGRSALADASRRLADERRLLVEGRIRQELGDGPIRLLDVGCGGGLDLRWWLDRGWPPSRLAGCDVVDARVSAARAACPGVDIRLADGMTLPFADASFDVAHAATVFSSILDPGVRRVLFAEMARIVRPGGLVFVYDFRVRKPTNRHVAVMGRKELAALGRPPDHVRSVSPFIYGVAIAGMVGRAAASSAMRVLPRTHLLASWSVRGEPPARTSSSDRSLRRGYVAAE
jgi:SAM-dependent methyltransferase